MLKLKCECCGTDYEKPEDFKKWYDEQLARGHSNVFFKWSLTYCDKCRREKEVKALKHLPDVINALSNINNSNK